MVLKTQAYVDIIIVALQSYVHVAMKTERTETNEHDIMCLEGRIFLIIFRVALMFL